MTGVRPQLWSDLPEEARQLLTAPPLMEKKLLELELTFAGLSASQTTMADALRLFVITWDPLEPLAPRPYGFAAVNTGSLGLELAVYVPIWSLLARATRGGASVAATLGAIAGSVVVTAATHADTVVPGRFPEALMAGKVADLLADPAAGAALGPPTIRPDTGVWEDLGLGAITDIVQHALGPVALDRAPVELAVSTQPRPGCPACAARRFNFPADLAESAEQMCPPHRREADKVIQQRLARARDSNPAGFAAITDASDRISRPHLPNGLATRLVGAEAVMFGDPDPGELKVWARSLAEAAGWFPDRPTDFFVALGQDLALAGLPPEWLANLPRELGRAGLVDEIVMLGEALVRLDPRQEPYVAGDVAEAMGAAGLADETRGRVEANLARWPHDLHVRMNAGDAMAALGDNAAARAHYEIALIMADEDDYVEGMMEARERIEMLEEGVFGPVRRGPGLVRSEHGRRKAKRSAKRRPGRSPRKRRR